MTYTMQLTIEQAYALYHATNRPLEVDADAGVVKTGQPD